MDNFMKTRIALSLCVALGAGFISIRAADTPAQATARVALERVLNPPDDSQIRSLPATNTLSEAVVEQPDISDTIATETLVTETLSETAVTPQVAPVATTSVAAPTAVIPAAVTPVAVSPPPVAPAAAPAPAMPFLMLWGLLLSLLLISFVIMSILLLKLRQVKLMLLKHRAVMAPSEIQPAAAKASPSTEQRGKSNQRLKAEG